MMNKDKAIPHYGPSDKEARIVVFTTVVFCTLVSAFMVAGTMGYWS